MSEAIQVKLLGATATKPTRLKVTASGVKTLIKSIDSFDTNHPFKSVEQQAAEELATREKWIGYDNWTYEERILRGGHLANNIYAFIIISIPFEARPSFIEFMEL